MTQLVHDVLEASAQRHTEHEAVRLGARRQTYGELAAAARRFARAACGLGLKKNDRIGIYLSKRFETVAAMFGASMAGCVYVPINPLLKSAQVAHIMRDCQVQLLVTNAERARDLHSAAQQLTDLRHLVLIDEPQPPVALGQAQTHAWTGLDTIDGASAHRTIDADMAAILYTSGSTGKPKGVVLSHRNIVTGAASVSQYLGNTHADRLLAVLPLSFDYGMSQLTTAFLVGASVTLIDYLLPRDILTAAARDRITGLAGVPPLWAQLVDLSWPAEVKESLRYITNSGGAMPTATLRKLRAHLPRTQVFLMYGLTEAFRSTYLPPVELDRRPESMGKAIPNAEIVVVNATGQPCAPNEPGELVHRGSLVALGYWNDAEKTAERFRPAPGQPAGIVIPEIAVWSGDTVRMDEDGFLYFIGRRDEMIKTSGYRVSPTELEEVAYATGLVGDAVALGVPHDTLGQAIVLVVSPAADGARATTALLDQCRAALPAFMVPAHVEWRDRLPRNANGKFDRKQLASELANLFATPGAA
jgi:acyl-CoA ligase (AMP-forming) (exosortase A-associated)